MTSVEPADDGHLRLGLRKWKRKPKVADTLILGDCDDANIVAFAWVDAIEGEWPDGQAVLTLTTGPIQLDDGWSGCDDPLDC